ncbi:MAG: hypothetical protein L3J39_02065 [Verrucomicrobiales bacterium]|nr:hypothetical protein [Verrucomicrobiales bacterium]
MNTVCQNKKGFSLCLAVGVFSCTVLLGQSVTPLSEVKKNQAPARTTELLDLKKFPGALVQQVVVPVPGEIFSVLDKLGEQDWSSEISIPKRKVATDRVRLALVFGCTVAEGFVTVEAEDRKAIQNTGRRVLRLADTLGLKSAVLPHSQSIIDSADSGDWNAVRRGFDQTQVTVKKTMEKMRDEEIATLVSLGGWLRGTTALTRLIAESYSSDRAELLNQPDLVAYFIVVIDGMKVEIKEQADVKVIHEGLREIERIMEEGQGGISEGAVSSIGAICLSLLQRFYFDEEPQSES